MPNARFLILPWVQSKNLASMILAKAAKILPHRWQEVYGDGQAEYLLPTHVIDLIKSITWEVLGEDGSDTRRRIAEFAGRDARFSPCAVGAGKWHTAR